jgi:hypothetical protein
MLLARVTACLFVLGIVTVGAARQSDHPGGVENIAILDGLVTADIVNTGTVAWTGWSVEMRRGGDANTAARFRQTTDVYASTAMLDEADNAAILKPGERRRLVFAPAAPQDFESAPEVYLLAVLQSDRSAWGDEAIANQMFDARAAELRKAEDLLDELTKSKAAAEAPSFTIRRLTSRAQALGKATQGGKSSQVAGEVSSIAVQSPPSGVASATDDAATLDFISLLLTRRVAAARLHSTPREK